MKQDDFLNNLSALAEIKPIKPPATPSRRELDEPNLILRDGLTFTVDKNSNPTWAYEIKKIKQSVPCPDCGKKNARGRVVNIRRCEYPEPHWSKSCNICKNHWNPLTGEFDCTVHQASNNWVSYFKRDK